MTGISLVLVAIKRILMKSSNNISIIIIAKQQKIWYII